MVQKNTKRKGVVNKLHVKYAQATSKQELRALI